MSALTGLPLYLGWDNHVQLRGAPIEAISARTQEIKSFYETIDPFKAHTWARDQGIRYIVVGDREYVAYPKLKVELFDQYEDQFKIVFKSGRARIYEIR